ncbi:hypothetical protein STEG23_024337 [Scotinomys teguina]
MVVKVAPICGVYLVMQGDEMIVSMVMQGDEMIVSMVMQGDEEMVVYMVEGDKVMVVYMVVEGDEEMVVYMVEGDEDLHDTGRQQDNQEEFQRGPSTDGVAETRGLEPFFAMDTQK